ncbi:MAG: hypothetical protein ACI9J3_003156 [Parvicellaceae bacterium]|jgi:hypothetical protein
MDSETIIIRLLERKAFIELSISEKETVLSSMTEEEYSLQRMVVSSMEDLTDEDRAIMHPSPAIKHAVYERMGEEEPKRIGVIAAFFIFLTRPIPAYSFAIPLIALLFAIPWILRHEPVGEKITVAEVVEPIVRIDTVFVEKEIPVEVLTQVTKIIRVPEVKYVERKKASVNYSGDLLVSRTTSLNEQIAEAEARYEDQIIQIGKSASENKLLDQFLTGPR